MVELKSITLDELKNIKNSFIIDCYNKIIKNQELNPKNLYNDFYEIILDNKVIGYVGSVSGIDKYGRIEARILIKDEYELEGYGTTALGLFTDIAFSNIHIHTIYGLIEQSNLAAARVFAKNHYHVNEEESDELLFLEKDNGKAL